MTTTTQTHLTGLCSGTLVGCRTFVTAAHCVCSDADDFLACTQTGLSPRERLRVFFQQAGFAQVTSVTISPDFSFGQAGDIAVLQLSEPVEGVAPSPINSLNKPTAGTGGTIVGFGRTINDATMLSDAGIKREGKVTVADCNRVVPNSTHVCWQFLGTDSSTCSGDSGGPLFIDFGDGPRLAGVTSGGSNGTCEAPDRSFDTDVFVYSDWVDEQIEDCATVTPPTADAVTLLSTDGDLTRANADSQFTVDGSRQHHHAAVRAQRPARGCGFRFVRTRRQSGVDHDLRLRRSRLLELRRVRAQRIRCGYLARLGAPLRRQRHVSTQRHGTDRIDANAMLRRLQRQRRGRRRGSRYRRQHRPRTRRDIDMHGAGRKQRR